MRFLMGKKVFWPRSNECGPIKHSNQIANVWQTGAIEKKAQELIEKKWKLEFIVLPEWNFFLWHFNCGHVILSIFHVISAMNTDDVRMAHTKIVFRSDLKWIWTFKLVIFICSEKPRKSLCLFEIHERYASVSHNSYAATHNSLNQH